MYKLKLKTYRKAGGYDYDQPHRARPKPPVILSKRRYCQVLSRACDCENRQALEAVEEERRYRAYLKEGSDALVKLFSGNISRTQQEKIEELREQRNAEIAKAKASRDKTQAIDEETRKERIERARLILESMKPGPQKLQRALVESEIARVRKYYDCLNAEFAKADRRQKERDAKLCPETPLLSLAAENQIKAEEEKKVKDAQFQQDVAKYMENQRLRKQHERDQNVIDGFKYRSWAECMQREGEAKQVAVTKCKQEQCRRNLKEVIEDKKYAQWIEKTIDRIDDRKNCVFNVGKRQLTRNVNKCVKSVRDTNIKRNQAQAVLVYRNNEALANKERERIQRDYELHETCLMTDEHQRNCRKEELAKERRKAQAEDAARLALEAKQNAELKRFHLAARFKNEEANMLYNKHMTRLQQRKKDEVKKVLNEQRIECEERRNAAAARMGECPEDLYTIEDKFFFEQAARLVQESKKAGRPLYPLARVIDEYKREHNIDELLKPNKMLVKRGQLNDYCLPNYIQRAKLKYAEYERQAKCHEAKRDELQEMANNCLIITKLVDSEKKPNMCKPPAHAALPQPHGKEKESTPMPMPMTRSQRSICAQLKDDLEKCEES